MAVIVKLQRFESLKVALDERLPRCVFSRREEMGAGIAHQSKILAQSRSSLRAAFKGTLAEINRSLNEVTGDLSQRQTNLVSDETELERHREELDRLKATKAESDRQLREMRTELEKTVEAAEKLGNLALETVDVERNFPLLQSRRNFFHIVTRIHWEKVSTNSNVVKGFVVNSLKNDVSTFKIDRRDLSGSLSCSLLWDYIGAGVSSDWNKI